jgi:sporulation integral membrane protein YtvI
LIIDRIIFEIKDLARQLPEFFETFSVQINTILDQGISTYFNLPVDLSRFIDTAIDSLASNISSIIMPITNATTRFAYSLPSILIFIIVLFISTYFISSDREKILSFIKTQIPEGWHYRVIGIKDDLLLALLGYVKAQLILMSITFIEISTGLLIIGVNYAILFGLLISLIDALPILGVGSILIPWALISMIVGNYYMAVSLLILYGIALLVRQMLEPRVLGAQIGLYPLVTLMGMYAGLKIFGIPGMIFGPIIILVIKNLNKAGIIKLWK